MRRLAIVASNDLWAIPAIASKVVALISTLDAEGIRTIYVRADASGKIASQVEELAVRMAKQMGIAWEAVQPEPGGRQQVYERDYLLVERVDKVMAFFHPERVMEGGTGHVVNAALAKEIPVEAWTLDDDGELHTIGSDDGSAMVSSTSSSWLRVRWMDAESNRLLREVAALGGWSKKPSASSTPPSSPPSRLKTFIERLTGLKS